MTDQPTPKWVEELAEDIETCCAADGPMDSAELTAVILRAYAAGPGKQVEEMRAALFQEAAYRRNIKDRRPSPSRAAALEALAGREV